MRHANFIAKGWDLSSRKNDKSYIPLNLYFIIMEGTAELGSIKPPSTISNESTRLDDFKLSLSYNYAQ